MKYRPGFLAMILICASVLSASAQQIRLATNTVVSFASVDAARNMLTKRDAFIAAMTPLDRRARMRVSTNVSEQAFLDFVGHNVRPWTRDETNRLTSVLQKVAEKLVPWNLPFPSTVLFIKTSGQEEFNFSYTRANAVVLPAHVLRDSAGFQQQLIIHELFHVLSRRNPQLRAKLYHIIGYEPINELKLPESFRAHMGTNPDGADINWAIGVTNQSHPLFVVPVLRAVGDNFDPNQLGALEDYFRLMVVTNADGRWSPRLVDGSPELLKLSEVNGFFQQVGRNTSYIIHPDEILADNFVRLMTGDTKLPSPRITEEMKRLLTPP